MKRLFLLVLLWPLVAWSEPISLNFREIPVIGFAEATYRAILGRDFMTSPDVVGLDKRVTISVKSVDKSKLPKLLADVLQEVGVRVREEEGIVRLERAAPLASGDGKMEAAEVAQAPQPEEVKAEEPMEYEVYRPQYRTVEYLQAALAFAGLSPHQGGMGHGGPSRDAMVIAGTEERLAKLRKLIADLDQKPRVVNVRAALVEFSDSHNDSWSIGGILSLLSGKLSITTNATNNSMNFARIKTGGIDVVLGAMNGDSRFRYRSQPSIRLVDGEAGKLQVGSDVPVRGNITITQAGQQIQATEYKPSGLVLSVHPRVLHERVQAKVVQEVSSFTKTNTSGIDAPTLNKRLIETVVDAEDGEVVILAGMDEDSTSEGQSGLASWLPLSQATDHRRTQLLVLLEFQRL